MPVLLLCAACLAGCLEIKQTIELEEDGSGRLVEVVRLSDELLQASQSSPELAVLGDCLNEERARERMKLFGEVTFVSHEVKDLGGRGRESRTVFAFKDISRLTLPAAPHRGANPDRSGKMTFRLGEPVLVHEAWRNAYYKRKPLTISLTPKTDETRGAARSLSPAQEEQVKALLPVVRAMLAGFRATVEIEAFGPVEGTSKTHVVFRLTDEDLKEDDTLMKVIEWNRCPDRWLGARGNIGAAGLIRNESYSIGIALPFEKEEKGAGGRGSESRK